MIDLSSSLLKLVGAMKHDDPAAEEALRNLDSVRVHVYDTGGDEAPAARRMAAVKDMLSAQGWEQIVRVREPDDQVDIYVKHGGERIQGITIMAVDPEEAAFINVLGDIDPAKLNDVVSSIEVGHDLETAMQAP